MSMRNITTEIINTTKPIADLVDWLILRHTPRDSYLPTMYIDLEGVDLCREGSLSILTLLIDTRISTRHVYLIDVHTLGAQAFKTAGANQKTLKDILQDEKIRKVFFDVRNDSDALFAHFGVALQGVEDVQVMESATRKTTASRKFLSSLVECLKKNLIISGRDSKLADWMLVNEKGQRLFKAEHGGSYDVFNQRPIPEDIISYCVSGVQYLPELRNHFCYNRANMWNDLVCEESKKRIAASQRLDYQPHGSDKTIAPWSKEQNIILDEWYYVPPPCYDSDESFSLHDDGYDDGPTSCRDIIPDWDLDYYYSD